LTAILHPKKNPCLIVLGTPCPLSWQGDETDVKQGLPHSQLAPPWQILILGDGSPTRHLQLLTGEKTEVDVIDMSPIGDDEDGAPMKISLIP
jgi:chorismate lyase